MSEYLAEVARVVVNAPPRAASTLLRDLEGLDNVHYRPSYLLEAIVHDEMAKGIPSKTTLDTLAKQCATFRAAALPDLRPKYPPWRMRGTQVGRAVARTLPRVAGVATVLAGVAAFGLAEYLVASATGWSPLRDLLGDRAWDEVCYVVDEARVTLLTHGVVPWGLDDYADYIAVRLYVCVLVLYVALVAGDRYRRDP